MKFIGSKKFRAFLAVVGTIIFFAWAKEFIKDELWYLPFIIALLTCALIASIVLEFLNNGGTGRVNK